jgi:hypothetical protein
MNHGKAAALMALAALLAACDSAKSPKPAAAPSNPPQAVGRNLSSVDVCLLMPDKVVAQILSNKVTHPGKRRDEGATSKGCMYGLGSPHKGTYEYVHIFLTSPELFQPLESQLETERGLSLKATGEILTGLGDEAFAVHGNSDTSVNVLRRGDVWLEVKANNLDHARKLAESVLQRLGPR